MQLYFLETVGEKLTNMKAEQQTFSKHLETSLLVWTRLMYTGIYFLIRNNIRKIKTVLDITFRYDTLTWRRNKKENNFNCFLIYLKLSVNNFIEKNKNKKIRTGFNYHLYCCGIRWRMNEVHSHICRQSKSFAEEFCLSFLEILREELKPYLWCDGES